MHVESRKMQIQGIQNPSSTVYITHSLSTMIYINTISTISFFITKIEIDSQSSININNHHKIYLFSMRV
jgi:hypothetical protein